MRTQLVSTDLMRVLEYLRDVTVTTEIRFVPCAFGLCVQVLRLLIFISSDIPHEELSEYLDWVTPTLTCIQLLPNSLILRPLYSHKSFQFSLRRTKKVNLVRFLWDLIRDTHEIFLPPRRPTVTVWLPILFVNSLPDIGPFSDRL